MSKTPICDKWEYDTNQGGLVVPLNVAKDLETELAEARAEIERLKNQLEDESMRADGMTTAHAEAGAGNYRMRELIEQMRDALRLALPEARSTHCENTIKAALAAERGE